MRAHPAHVQDVDSFGHFSKVNEIVACHFKEPYPARAALGVASLARGALVEIDAVMHLDAGQRPLGAS